MSTIDSEIEMYERRLREMRASGDTREEGNALKSLAFRYSEKGEIPKALQLIDEAIRKLQEVAETYDTDMSNAYHMKGDILAYKVGDRRAAMVWTEKAVDTAMPGTSLRKDLDEEWARIVERSKYW